MISMFSDLDKTLVFSHNEQHCCVERKEDGTKLTYMTRPAKEHLDALIAEPEKFQLIPCTLRSLEQTERISFTGQCRFKICDNGGSIYIDGHRLAEWDNIVSKHINKEDVAKKRTLICSMLEKWGLSKYKVKTNGDCFINVIFNSLADSDRYAEKIARMIDSSLYVYHNQGRKIYFMPHWLNKKKAVDYLIKEFELKGDNNMIITSGDSSVDTEFITLGDVMIIPEHATFENRHAIRTKQSGIYAGEEIISIASRLVSKGVNG